MARNNALITPKILTWARGRLDLSLEEAADYVQVIPETLKAWEEGSRQPTVNQAKDIAKKYKIPYVNFFLPEPPQNINMPKKQDYRTFHNEPPASQSVALKAFLYDIIQRREVMIELYKEMDIKLPEFTQYLDAGSVSNSDIAEAIRNLLSLPATSLYKNDQRQLDERETFNYLRNKFEEAGILVFQTVNIDPAEMRGLSVNEKTFPIVVVNRKDSYNARNFTLIHELAHLITRTAGICNKIGISESDSVQIELKCNQIAALALVPENLLINNAKCSQLLNNWDDRLVRNIGNAFGVSREVIIGRLYSLKKISFNFYKSKLDEYTAEYKKNNPSKNKKGFTDPPTNIGSQMGKMYARTVLNAYNQDLITPRDAIQFFNNLRLSHFDSLERWCFS
jgi:Zn-dependent peptidase ImmA (M78 family)/DNA-binding XRE family transcriptional regulator